MMRSKKDWILTTCCLNIWQMLIDFALLRERLKVLLLETSQSHFLQPKLYQTFFRQRRIKVSLEKLVQIFQGRRQNMHKWKGVKILSNVVGKVLLI